MLEVGYASLGLLGQRCITLSTSVRTLIVSVSAALLKHFLQKESDLVLF